MDGSFVTWLLEQIHIIIVNGTEQDCVIGAESVNGRILYRQTEYAHVMVSCSSFLFVYMDFYESI